MKWPVTASRIVVPNSIRTSVGVKPGLINSWAVDQWVVIFLLAAWWCNNHLEKYEFVNGKDDIPIYIMENKKCSEPPTS